MKSDQEEKDVDKRQEGEQVIIQVEQIIIQGEQIIIQAEQLIIQEKGGGGKRK